MTSPEGCTAQVASMDTVDVIGVIADFLYQPEIPTIDDPWVQVFDTSQPDASVWSWILEGDGVSSEENPIISLDSLAVGEYELCLAVISPETCRDTTCRTIDLQTNFQIWVPNTFTPDDNRLNDVFKPVINHPEDLVFYEFRVFDRRGKLKHETEDYRSGWDGLNVRDNGIMQGLYQYEVLYRIKIEFKFRRLRGHLTLSK